MRLLFVLSIVLFASTLSVDSKSLKSGSKLTKSKVLTKRCIKNQPNVISITDNRADHIIASLKSAKPSQLVGALKLTGLFTLWYGFNAACKCYSSIFLIIMK